MGLSSLSAYRNRQSSGQIYLHGSIHPPQPSAITSTPKLKHHHTKGYPYTMQRLQQIWQNQPFAILDGGLATQLESHGADLHDPLWSARVLLEEPQLVQQVHTDYLEAGADIIATATYQATFTGLLRKGLSRTAAAEIFRRGVTLGAAAREQFLQNLPAVTSRAFPLIAASIGPFGAFLADGSEYHGRYPLSKRELIDWHRPQVKALVATKADLLAFETIPSLLEAEALVALLKEFPDTYAWISFSCRDAKHLSHGERWAEAVALVSRSAQVVAVGINCTDPLLITPLLRSAKDIASVPFIVYPNSGERWDAARKCWMASETNFELASAVREWYAAGAHIIGGCCRTGPEQIRGIREVMQEI